MRYPSDKKHIKTVICNDINWIPSTEHREYLPDIRVGTYVSILVVEFLFSPGHDFVTE